MIKITTNQKIKSILGFDFETLVERKKNHFKMITSSNMLLSASSFTKFITEYELYPVPEKLLERKRQIGSQVMELLYQMFEKKTTDVDQFFYDEAVKNRVQALLNWFHENKVKISAVEKFITDGHWCGYLDVVAQWSKSNLKKSNWCIFEIKCRNDFKIKMQDEIQMEIYRKMMNYIDVYLLVIDDNLNIKAINYKKETKGKDGKATKLTYMISAFNFVKGKKFLSSPTPIIVKE